MVGRAPRSVRSRYVVGATALLAAVGAAAFWAWRERAPIARSYRRAKRRSREERDARGPNPEREPGTDPV
ncbi:hypothetical protein [Haladaptatus salinisoli]|uniref:hypothetical protein n=1 Tax=Haladaptatus salinisoli TaxID=2884876 RepID=UPI001D0B2E87|nr:hypothetical protein [Haladaptatus salinisoli]